MSKYNASCSEPYGVRDMLPSRFSIPLSIHPNPDAVIDSIIKYKDEVEKHELVDAGEWQTYNARKNYTSLPATAA